MTVSPSRVSQQHLQQRHGPWGQRGHRGLPAGGRGVPAAPLGYAGLLGALDWGTSPPGSPSFLCCQRRWCPATVEPGHAETCAEGVDRHGDMGTGGQPEPGVRGAANPTPDPFSAPIHRLLASAVPFCPAGVQAPSPTPTGHRGAGATGAAGIRAQARAGGTEKPEVGGNRGSKTLPGRKTQAKGPASCRGVSAHDPRP